MMCFPDDLLVSYIQLQSAIDSLVLDFFDSFSEFNEKFLKGVKI